MSDNSDLQQIIFKIELWQISNFTVLSANVLWIFDYIQTLPMEIEAIWMNKMSASSILFLLNRYIFIACLVSQITFTMSGMLSDSVCHSLGIVSNAAEIATILTTSCLISLRVYAIYSKSRLILIVGMMLTFGRLSTDIVNTISLSGGSTRGEIYEPFSPCATNLDSSIGIYLKVNTSTLVLVLAFDSFMFVMTIFKTFRHGREMRRLGQVSITQLIQHDGIMYFLVAAVLSSIMAVIQILSFSLGGNLSLSTSTFSSIITPYHQVFPNLLINRLVLNLRTFQRPRYGRKTTTPKLPDLAVATNRVLGNIGAPLDPDQWDEEYDVGDTEDLEQEVLGERTDQQLGEEEVQDVALENLAATDFATSEGPADEERRMTPVQGTGGLSMVSVEDVV